MRVQYTALMADARGKLAGTVGKNKGGNYLRTKAIPINPKTTYQSIQRGCVRSVESIPNHSHTRATSRVDKLR